ncbi:unnamed protein product [Schistocephalus solidus]|uniref:Uncharacterized protein n=1 Tax=Schistocephalus solidus TaxID=70667 RepID=A0A183SNQ2_SCHSO|nr:unnamed protein product [Schistocephalus solidus]
MYSVVLITESGCPMRSKLFVDPGRLLRRPFIRFAVESAPPTVSPQRWQATPVRPHVRPENTSSSVAALRSRLASQFDPSISMGINAVIDSRTAQQQSPPESIQSQEDRRREKTQVAGAAAAAPGLVREEQVTDCSRRHARWGLHTPTVEKVPVSSVGDTDPRVLMKVGVHQHGREHETEEGRCQYAALLHSVGHCECFGYHPVFSDARRHPVMKLMPPKMPPPFRAKAAGDAGRLDGPKG